MSAKKSKWQTIADKWKEICAIIGCTAVAGGVVWGIFSYEASNKAAIDSLKTDNAAIHSDMTSNQQKETESIRRVYDRLNPMASDISEIKGEMHTLLEIEKAKEARDVRNTNRNDIAGNRIVKYDE